MVRVSTVKSVRSTTIDQIQTQASPNNKTPNRFRSKFYDRSVYSGEDCQKSFGKCSCYQCYSRPLVVVSSGDFICSQYNITSRNLKEFVDGGLVDPVEQEGFMIYAQRNSFGQLQIGILAALDVMDCKTNIIKRHEMIIPEEGSPIPHRTKQFQSLYVDPIMVMYRQNAIVDEIVQRIINKESPIDLCINETEKCLEQYLWNVTDEKDIDDLKHAFEHISSMYIADGHHRTADACRNYPSVTNKTINHKSTPYITALIFPDNQLNVLSFNRCVRSLGDDISNEFFFQKVNEKFLLSEVEPSRAIDNSPSGAFRMYFQQKWYDLKHRSRDISSLDTDNLMNPSDETKDTLSLDIDAQLLVEELFEPVLGMTYPQSESNMIYIDGRSGPKAIQDIVDSGEACVGFSVRRVTTNEIMSLSDANRLLPPKATFFDPKPMSGLMLRLKR